MQNRPDNRPDFDSESRKPLWAMLGSNQRLPPCEERNELPASPNDAKILISATVKGRRSGKIPTEPPRNRPDFMPRLAGDGAMIAALYVMRGGVYWGLPGVDPWDEPRDDRLYAGPWPIVAHPPCARWGRYWSGGPSAKVRRTKGDDGGCFAAALAAVRRWGGVLEHPEASHAWRAHGLVAPPRHGGWVCADFQGGWTCCVEQGHYGHPARKATWLYAWDVELPSLKWGASSARSRLDEGYHSAEERRRAIRTGACQRLSHRQCEATPPAFRDLLLSIATTASTERTSQAGLPFGKAVRP